MTEKEHIQKVIVCDSAGADLKNQHMPRRVLWFILNLRIKRNIGQSFA
jgi:hypothetical protein